MYNQTAYAHAGEHHSKSCFLTVGDTKLRLNGYYLNTHLAGKHFCRIYPSNGQIVLAIDVLADDVSNKQLGLNLSALSGWREWSERLFTSVKQMPAKPIGTGLFALEHMIEQPNLYALDIVLLDTAGNHQTQRIFLIAGIPVTQYLIYFAGLLLLIIALVWVKSFSRNKFLH